MDIYTPTGADMVDDIPPYIGGGRHGQISDIPYKDDVAGSSPVPPTKIPPYMGVFDFLTPSLSNKYEALILFQE